MPASTPPATDHERHTSPDSNVARASALCHVLINGIRTSGECWTTELHERQWQEGAFFRSLLSALPLLTLLTPGFWNLNPPQHSKSSSECPTTDSEPRNLRDDGSRCNDTAPDIAPDIASTRPFAGVRNRAFQNPELAISTYAFLNSQGARQLRGAPVASCIRILILLACCSVLGVYLCKLDSGADYVEHARCVRCLAHAGDATFCRSGGRSGKRLGRHRLGRGRVLGLRQRRRWWPLRNAPRSA